MPNVGVDAVADDGEGQADLERCGRSILFEQPSEQAVLELGIEVREADALVGDGVGVGSFEALDEAMEAWSSLVLVP